MWTYAYGPYVSGNTLPPIEQAGRYPSLAGLVAEFQRANFRAPATWIELADFMQQYVMELYGTLGLHDAQVKQRIKAFLPGRW